MVFTRTQSIRALKVGGIIIAATIIVGYAAWRSLNYARGPTIEIFQPIDGSTVASSTTDIIGQADRLNSLTVNGMSTSLDKQGGFKETLVIFPGVNFITFEGIDQFGRVTEKRLEIMY